MNLSISLRLLLLWIADWNESQKDCHFKKSPSNWDKLSFGRFVATVLQFSLSFVFNFVIYTSVFIFSIWILSLDSVSFNLIVSSLFLSRSLSLSSLSRSLSLSSLSRSLSFSFSSRSRSLSFSWISDVITVWRRSIWALTFS